jgi:hypothetical protein
MANRLLEAPRVVTGCKPCDKGCRCEALSGGCEHWACWAAKGEAACPSAEPHRAALRARYPRLFA